MVDEPIGRWHRDQVEAIELAGVAREHLLDHLHEIVERAGRLARELDVAGRKAEARATSITKHEASDLLGAVRTASRALDRIAERESNL